MGNYRRAERVLVEFYAECDICGWMTGPEFTQADAEAEIAEHVMADHKEPAALIDDGIGVTL